LSQGDKPRKLGEAETGPQGLAVLEQMVQGKKFPQRGPREGTIESARASKIVYTGSDRRIRSGLYCLFRFPALLAINSTL